MTAEGIDGDMCAQISAVAEKVDTTELLSRSSGKVRSAKSLSRKLEAFQKDAANKFADELLNTHDMPIMVKSKQNLLMNLALARGGSAVEALAEEIEERYDKLVGQYGKRNMLEVLAPVLKIGANE